VIYLFCVKWKAIHIASMRYFNTLEELEAHIRYNGTPQQWSDHAAGEWHAYRVYSNGTEAKSLSLKECRAIGLRP